MSDKTTLPTSVNDFIGLSYKLTLNEQRLVLIAVSLINSMGATPSFRLRDGLKMRVTAKSFSVASGIELQTAYGALADTCDRLYGRSVKKITSEFREEYRLISCAEYLKGEGAAEITWSPEILPYLVLLGKQLSTHEIKQMMALNSPYSIRLYESLKLFSAAGQRFFTVNQFRVWLDMKNTYPRYYDLKKRVIDPAVRDVNLHTDITVKWSVQKEGRTVSSLQFYFDSKKP